MVQLIKFQGREFSEEESKLVTDTYRSSIRGKSYAREYIADILAKYLDIKVNIHYATSSAITALQPDEEKEIDLNTETLQPANSYGTNSNTQIDLFFIGPHFELLKREENSYKRVGINTDSNCLYNAIIKATKDYPSIVQKNI
ncbi:hypothetical protein [Moorena producens]|uniref:hypothetical protein n=1 Tax=Moorena producens TaxID=1155739 RepID=UPI003C749FE3